MRTSTKKNFLKQLIPFVFTVSIPLSEAAQSHWIGSWGASPVFPVGQDMNQNTIRQFVTLSQGGEKIQLRFSNETGTQPLMIGAVTIARPGAKPGSIDSKSLKQVLFGGQKNIIIPPGAPALSDPIDFNVNALDDVAISLYLPQRTGLSIVHPNGEQTAWIDSNGNTTANEELSQTATTSTMRFYLSRVEVATDQQNGGTIVTLGDSITDGYSSGVDMNQRWPDVLAKRLKQANINNIGIVNAGISGNRILNDLPSGQNGPSSLSRLDRDVLSVPNVRWLVIMQGINDIGHSNFDGLTKQEVSADEIINGWKQLISRAKNQGIKTYCATLTPFKGEFLNFYSEKGEEKRQAINTWIRTSNTCDAVIDFDAVIRDDKKPQYIKAEFDVGDGLHPNANGLKAMAESIDINLFN
ncbi:SGNH/GDSL hydrolase family protein [Orbus wheelerorum]|uniref:SGNH/GDSL hydrolase family protein n=1 Tax=Orbus wheelerorum TaxID=3074111 RepID=UPI00370D5CF9